MQETRTLLEDTHTAAVWLQANGSTSNNVETGPVLRLSAEDTEDVMETCKGILTMLTDGLSIAKQNVRCLLPGVKPVT